MKEDYFIINEYVRDSSFESHLTPELFVNPYNGMSNLETSLSLEIKNLPGTALFLVSIIVLCTTKLDDGRALFELTLRYDILVAIKHDLSYDSIQEYLRIIIPQEAYSRIKDAIYRRTKDIGFSPILLDDFSFRHNKVSIDQVEQNRLSKGKNMVSNDIVKNQITFDSLIENIENYKEGAEFLQVFRNNGGQLNNFEDFNLFRYMFRYMKYTDYCVAPDVLTNSESKKLIYYLITASDECEWRLEKCENSQQPELVFKYNELGEDVYISRMTDSELFELCTLLIVDLITNAAVNILLIESETGELKLPKITNFVTREDYRNAFEYQSLGHEHQVFVDSMYDKIAKTQVETFLYQ